MYYQPKGIMDPNVQSVWTKDIIRFYRRDPLVKIVRKKFGLKFIDILTSGDNFSSHCSEQNLRQSREADPKLKLNWAFTSGGCTDVIAVILCL